MQKLQVVIVSPALADANNGNWQTAKRWKRLLAPHAVRIVQQWPDAQAHNDQVMLALHARRSAASLQAWFARRGQHGLGLVLTGTDVYRDIVDDPSAQQSLALSAALLVLQPLAVNALPAAYHAKTRVILQSTTPRKRLSKTQRYFRAVMVGHLRAEKDPLTLMAAAQHLRPDDGIQIHHIGNALDATLGTAALQTQTLHPHYQWLGARPHSETRQRIQRAHALVHTSTLEGGAHVIMEAVCSGTPVLASRIDGNIGLLGQDYAGYFDVGNVQQLVQLLRACRSNSNHNPLMDQLKHQCALRAPLFNPDAEQAALHHWVQELWNLNAIQ